MLTIIIHTYFFYREYNSKRVENHLMKEKGKYTLCRQGAMQ